MRSFILLLLFFPAFTFAQSIERVVISTAGEVQTISGTAIVSWSIGEPMVENYLATNHITQGFQQGAYSPVLPVDLIDFQAKRRSPTLVDVNWEAAWNGGFQGFWLERKLENESDFQPIQFIEPYELETASFYQVLDKNDFYGNSYYRLKMVEENKKDEYSTIKVVAGIPLKHQIAVFPNPTEREISLALTPDYRKIPQQVSISILNNLGKLEWQMDVDFQYRLDLTTIGKLAKGIYWMQIALDGEWYATERFVKL